MYKRCSYCQSPYTPGTGSGLCGEAQDLPWCIEQPRLLVLLMGLPGSGKSTLARRLATHGYLVLCADSLRLALLGDEGSQRHQDMIWGTLRRATELAMADGRPRIVLDNTNITQAARKVWLKLAERYGYRVIQLYLAVPADECLRRMYSRDRQVPHDVVYDMERRMTIPKEAVPICPRYLER